MERRNFLKAAFAILGASAAGMSVLSSSAEAAPVIDPQKDLPLEAAHDDQIDQQAEQLQAGDEEVLGQYYRRRSYYRRPVYYRPRRVYYRRAVYSRPRRVYYRPRPVYYRPRRVYYRRAIW